MAESEVFDIAIVGAGIVGLATSVALTDRWPMLRVVVLEKEKSLAAHQTGRNSGVVHSGVYYKPGSFKALLCRAGNESIVRFCSDHGLPYERCGKLIVASTEAELAQLGELSDRAQASDIPASIVTREEIAEREPAVVGVGGLWIPSTGITNYKAILNVLAQLTRERDGTIMLGAEVCDFSRAGREHVLQTSRGAIRSRFLVTCGVMSFPGFWRLARRHGRAGMDEVARSMSKRLFLTSLRRLIPELELEDLVPTHAGIRAQLLERSGALVDDFLILRGDNAVHVCNAPSPAATSSLQIGHKIADELSNAIG